jgi:hypothetical protein
VLSQLAACRLKQSQSDCPEHCFFAPFLISRATIMAVLNKQSDGRVDMLSRAHAHLHLMGMSWEECSAVPGKDRSDHVGMASAAKRSVIVKKFQICVIISMTSIVGWGSQQAAGEYQSTSRFRGSAAQQ